jgi:hypothetical protein
MAGASLLALLDDIAVLLDDVSVMTKVAAKKTAGVLGDDLAVNAEKVTGVTRRIASCPWCGPCSRARCSTRRSWCRRHCSLRCSRRG